VRATAPASYPSIARLEAALSPPFSADRGPWEWTSPVLSMYRILELAPVGSCTGSTSSSRKAPSKTNDCYGWPVSLSGKPLGSTGALECLSLLAKRGSETVELHAPASLRSGCARRFPHGTTIGCEIDNHRLHWAPWVHHHQTIVQGVSLVCSCAVG
jgi:hypothetical protein